MAKAQLNNFVSSRNQYKEKYAAPNKIFVFAWSKERKRAQQVAPRRVINSSFSELWGNFSAETFAIRGHATR